MLCIIALVGCQTVPERKDIIVLSEDTASEVIEKQDLIIQVQDTIISEQDKELETLNVEIWVISAIAVFSTACFIFGN